MPQNAGMTKLHLGVEKSGRKPWQWLVCGWSEVVDRGMVKSESDRQVETHPFPETGKGQATYLIYPDNFLLSDYKRNFT